MTALVYMEDLVYPDLLKEIEDRLSRFEIDGILESGMLEQLAEITGCLFFRSFRLLSAGSGGDGDSGRAGDPDL